MYYPKGKIETNLYSDGEFVVQSTNKVYHGLYFKTSNKQFFTGAEPSDDSKLLIPLNNTGDAEDSRTDYDLRFIGKNYPYSVLTNQPKVKDRIVPIPYYPQLTSEDYQLGSFIRYFAKKRNEILYYEVEAKNLLELRNAPIYLPFVINWRISGPKDDVYNANKKSVELAMEGFPIPSFNLFLKDDYLKFWKPI